MKRNRTLWRSSTEAPFCIAALSPFSQAASCWCGTERSMPKTWASPSTTCGATSALLKGARGYHLSSSPVLSVRFPTQQRFTCTSTSRDLTLTSM
ncbi:hypothetical protein AAFF_G00336860 [Aldrovandia affinis]|uniref:Uncharacterized protein n=1 Tax=Aldrovandia affinis TaxID=143900 RepID=A0AAD7R6D8_9TELE|nr:hypothetical protein AAFF_G00336860 [Aldrovandia affinis]